MQLTSFFNYIPEWSEDEINAKFRQKVKSDIINLLNTEYLTDREMAHYLGYKDPNKIRPRRNELSNEKYTKPPILIQKGRRKCKIGGKTSIVWGISPESLKAYMENGEIN